MAKRNTINKGIFWITVNEQLDIEAFYPESSAELIHADSTKFAAKNVLAALNEIVDKIDSLDTGVTGVKGNAEPTYRKGNVNLTPDNIGAEPAIGTKNTAFNKNFGTTAGTVMEGNDSRVTQAVSDIEAIKQKNTAQDTEIAKKLNASEKGAANGVATLDAQGMVPASQLPSYVDDVLEFDSKSAFPTTGEDGKIYIAKDTNLQYRWSGTAYVEISPSLALGETAQTAYPGNKGKQNADDIAGIKDGTITVPNATRATYASQVNNYFTVYISDKDQTTTLHRQFYNGSNAVDIMFDSQYFSGVETSKPFELFITPKTTGVTAGTYQGLTIDVKGRVTKAKDMKYTTEDAVNAMFAALAPQADGKLSKKLYVYQYGDFANAAIYDASSDVKIELDDDLELTKRETANAVSLTNTGVIPGTYSALTVDKKGRATVGYQALYVINEGDPIPANLIVGGLIIEKHAQA